MSKAKDTVYKAFCKYGSKNFLFTNTCKYVTLKYF